ncbi:amino acid ABC transporter permease [uncultured Enterovirga sp.]|uniref:amino acid ABC transporter permease n=1 Tax=uncultured Enterovirga sp. TaxID=2026352 RepID=UPI0035CB2D3F
MAAQSLSFIRSAPLEAEPPPSTARGAVGWARHNLFSSPLNIALTAIVLLLLYVALPPFLRFMIIDAVWTGADRNSCREDVIGRPVGACWAFVWDRLSYFIYGSYPPSERWRVDAFFALLAFGAAWMLWLKAPRRDIGAVYFFVVFPVLSFILLTGWEGIGLPAVPTAFWGGILVTILVSVVGIVLSLPFGIVLALGRRSKLPFVRFACVTFIEVVRGVPLITVLIMANTMLPLFLPTGMSVDRLLRPLIGVSLFASAYMAEVVRGGLQAVPKGQYEGAMSLGLGYWRMMFFIVLPQALRIVIPGIVNTFIGLFKDTTLVSIVGLLDLVRTIEASRVDPLWAAPTVSMTGYAFAGLFYFVFCYGMSRYSLMVERRLAAGQRR